MTNAIPTFTYRLSKSGSRHADHAAKALRLGIEQLQKRLIKKRTLSLECCTLCLDPALLSARIFTATFHKAEYYKKS